MNAATKTTKRTAANTPLLKAARKLFNKPIYQHALDLYNAKGEDATLEYLQNFVVAEIKLTLTNYTGIEL